MGDRIVSEHVNLRSGNPAGIELDGFLEEHDASPLVCRYWGRQEGLRRVRRGLCQEIKSRLHQRLSETVENQNTNARSAPPTSEAISWVEASVTAKDASKSYCKREPTGTTNGI